MDDKQLPVPVDVTAGLIPNVSQTSQPSSVDVRVVVEDALERGKELLGVTYTSAMNYTLGSREASRPIKHRPTFTEDQISTMEAIFKQRQYLSPAERENVATAIGLTAQQVRVWFQNRRQKIKQFLSVKQHRSGGGEGTTPSKNDGIGNIQIDISSLLAQAQKSSSPQIDPQILQLLLPKTSTTDQNGSEEESSGVVEGDGGTTEEKDNEGGTIKGGTVSSPVDASSTSSLGIVTSNGTITLSPQTLLYLTPLLLPLNMQQGNAASSQTGSTTQTEGGGAASNNLTLPVNAVQLLQTLSAVSSRIQNSPQTQNALQSHSQSPKIPNLTPLRAQSPVPVEDTVNVSNNNSSAATADIPSGISSDVLQQIFGQSPDKSTKATWTLTATPPTSSSVALTLNPEGLSTPRKKRQVFSGYQISEMEKRFERSPYIDTKEREVLAKEIGLQADQVKVWFQNRRTKKTRLSWRQKSEGEIGAN